MVIKTGWIAVQRGVDIDFSLEQYSLDIKTDSTPGSDDKVHYMWFYTSQRDPAGGLFLYYSTTQYYIARCSSGLTGFLTDLPTATDKVWRVTLTRTSGIRLVVHCNEVEVLNTLMSDSTCGRNDWSTYWSRSIAKIEFNYQDTASDFYKPQPQPGNCVIQYLKSKIPR